jgi:TonB family protein
MNCLGWLLRVGFALLFAFSTFFIVALAQTSTQSQTPNKWQQQALHEIEELRQKIGQNPNDAAAHHKLGGLYQMLENWQEAVTAYERATQLKADFANAYYELGWCYGNLGKYEDALKAHQQAFTHAGVESFKLKLTKPVAQYAIAWDYYALRRYAEAMTAYQQVLTLDPKYQDALYEMGRIQIALGQRAEVLNIAQKLDAFFNRLLLKELELTAAGGPILPLRENKASQNQTPTSATAPVKDVNTSQPGQVGRVVFIYREKAKYTEAARHNKIQGVVALSVVFAADGNITRLRVIRGLPYGLTAQALLAAEKIRFKPATKDNQPVSVRATLEYSFNLY